MKCPKCQYISFDAGDRCRNCGYEFSLTVEDPRPDLRIQTGDEPLGPLADFALEVDRSHSSSPGADTNGADAIAVAAPRPITSSFDLPLFKERRTENDAPLVASTAAPRAPLSVRRSTPTPPRPSGRTTDEPALDLGPVPTRVVPLSAERIAPADQEVTDAAPVVARLLAAVVDGIILASIALIVLYLTLKICGVSFSRVAVIPPLPFASFLLLIAGGYFTLFTAAGGQTIGKMAAGIRVVPMDEDLHHSRVPLGVSILRAAAYLASALPAGAGFLPALAGADRRTIHDRLADTRVVKA